MAHVPRYLNKYISKYYRRSSWNWFQDDISETVIKSVADDMVAYGLVDVGYKYLNLDAGVWLPNRSAEGR